jgi:hypothetical protein
MTHKIISWSLAHLTQSTWHTLSVVDEWMRMMHRWNASDKETPEYSHKNLYRCHFVHTNPTCTGLGLIPGLCSDNVAPAQDMEWPTSLFSVWVLMQFYLFLSCRQHALNHQLLWKFNLCNEMYGPSTTIQLRMEHLLKTYYYHQAPPKYKSRSLLQCSLCRMISEWWIQRISKARPFTEEHHRTVSLDSYAQVKYKLHTSQ